MNNLKLHLANKSKNSLTIKTLIYVVIFLLMQTSFAQVGIGTVNPDSKSILDIVSSEKGILVPRMTQTQRDAIDPDDNQKGLIIFNTTTDCYNFWNTKLNKWKSLCGDEKGEIKSLSCSAIKVTGTYDSDDTVDNQNITISFTAKVTALGSYSYSATVNGITFTAIGNFMSLGPNTVNFYPASGSPTVNTGTFPATVTVSPTEDSANGITCTGIDVKFVSRPATTLKILNLQGEENLCNLVPGGPFTDRCSYGKVGEWLEGDDFDSDPSLATASSFAGTADVEIENFDPLQPGAVNSFCMKLEEVSIVWVGASEEYSHIAPAFGSLLNDWVNSGQGIVMLTGDKFEEAGVIQELGLWVEEGDAADIVPTGHNTLPEVFSSANGAPYTFNGTEIFRKSESNVGFITSKKSVTIGVMEPGGSFAGRPAISADLSRGIFVFGDKYGAIRDDEDQQATDDFGKYLVDIFVWALKNAPAK